MSPLPSSGEIYGLHFMPDTLDVDVLLPNGVYLCLNVNRNTTLSDLKTRAWNGARVMQFAQHLNELDKYIFCGINQDGEEEIYFNENRKLCDLRVFMPIFKVVEFSGNKEENLQNSEISQCIGMSVYDLNKEAVDEEVLAFRRRLVNIARVSYQEMNLTQPESLLRYLFAAPLSVNIPSSVRTNLQNCKMLFVHVCTDSDPSGKFQFTLMKQSTVEDAIVDILTRLHSGGGGGSSPASRRATRTSMSSATSMMMMTTMSSSSLSPSSPLPAASVWKANDYVLKACCDDTYLMDLKQPLIHFKYIQTCLGENSIPLLQLVKLKEVLKLHSSVVTPSPMIMPAYANWGLKSYEQLECQEFTSLWDVNAFFKVTVKHCTYVNVKDTCHLLVRVGIFHGLAPLTSPQETRERLSSSPAWNSSLDFDIHLVDLPRGSKLCICVVQRSTDKRARVPDTCLGWANLNVFDHLGYCLSGSVLLTLAPMATTNTGRSDFLNPIKPCQRPCRGGEMEGGQMYLSLEFTEKCQPPIRFPLWSTVLEQAEDVHAQEPQTTNLYNSNRQEIMKSIGEIVQRDPLGELSEQDKSTLWQFREHCLEKPESLPRLAESVKWNLQKDVLLFYWLLQKWPAVSRETAIHLLGPTYADPYLRDFAVLHVKQKTDHNDLEHYLLQFIQCIKIEPHLYNALTEYLIVECLKNTQLGLKFFWTLRSEMHDPNIRLRFGIILEGFCRGCGTFLSILRKQTEVIDKLSCLNDFIKTQREEDQVRLFQEKVNQDEMCDSLINFHSPLNHHCRYGNLEVTLCDIKKSKKRPLWLVWHNPDILGPRHISHYRMIFKMGDDLRQDMLTLQMLRLIDTIWKEEDKDLHLIPYGCLATGLETGIIEAVQDALTVMAIQRKQFRSALQLDHTMLHKWLQGQNRDPKDYESAIDVFTRSCAGYCVATFVLGIRDRHPDNIMLNRRGQLFHIDFGHFLNNRKKKFGINREKVPFVLTEDFAYVIARGSDNPRRSREFGDFAKTCSSAYLALRKHSRLFLTLFSLMVTCGLPELTSVDDLEYLRYSLAVEKTEVEALRFFDQQFNEACSYAWRTRVDWGFHWLNT